MRHADIVHQLNDNLRRIEDLERRMDTVEGVAARALDGLGKYRTRSAGELQVMRDVVDGTVLPTLENLVKHAELASDQERAKALLKRARNNRTRITKALDAAG
jgi:hypothetical protein